MKTLISFILLIVSHTSFSQDDNILDSYNVSASLGTNKKRAQLAYLPLASYNKISNSVTSQDGRYALMTFEESNGHWILMDLKLKKIVNPEILYSKYIWIESTLGLIF